MISRSIHVAANGVISFFLWLSSISLYICATSYLAIHAMLPQPVISALIFFSSTILAFSITAIGKQVKMKLKKKKKKKKKNKKEKAPDKFIIWFHSEDLLYFEKSHR